MGEENETKVVYKAIADFSSFSRATRAAKKNLQDLKKAEQEFNAESAKGEAIQKRSKKTVVEGAQKAKDATEKTTEAVKRQTKEIAESVGAIKKHSQESETATRRTRSYRTETDALARSARHAKSPIDNLVASIFKMRNSRRGGGRDDTVSWLQKTQTQADKTHKSFLRLGNWRPRLTPPFIALIPLIGGVLALVNPLIAGLGALGGVAVGLAGSLGSLGGALLALGPAFAAASMGIVSVIVAMGGMGDALKSYSKMQEASSKASKAAGTSAKEHAENVAQAERNLSRSHRNVQKAQDNLNEARKEALDDLIALRKEVARAGMYEDSAALRLAQAKEEYARAMYDPRFSDLEREAARVAVAEAEADLEDTLSKNKKNQEDLTKAEKAGVENSEKVISARERLADATDAVADAERALAKARKGDATTSALATATDEYNAALARLSPSARQVVQDLIALEGAWKSLKKNVQESFFGEFVDDMDALRVLLGPLEALLTEAGSAMGEIVSKGLNMLSSDSWTKDFYDSSKKNADIIRDVGDGVLYLTDAMRHLTVAATPFTEDLAEGFKKGSENLRDLIEAGRESGGLADWLETVGKRLSQWWRIVKNVSKTLFNYSSAASDFGQWLTDGLEESTKGWLEASERAKKEDSPFRKWLEDIKPLLVELKGLLGDFTGWIAGEAMDTENIEQFTHILEKIRNDLGPALADLLRTLAETEIGPDLVDAITSIVEALDSLMENGGGGAFKSFFDTLTFMFETLADLMSIPAVGSILGAVGSMIGVIAAASLVGKFTGLTSLFGWLIKLSKSPKVMDVLTSLGAVVGGKSGGGKHAAGRDVPAGTVDPKGSGGSSSGGGSTTVVGGGETRASRREQSQRDKQTSKDMKKASKDLAKATKTGGFKPKLGSVKGFGLGTVAAIGGDLAGGAIKDGNGGARDIGGSMLSNAATFGGTGAMIGSVIPGVGTAVGAAVGGVAGAFKGLMDEIGWDWLWEGLQTVGDKISGWFRDLPKNIGNWVTSAKDSVWDFVTDDIPNMATKVGDWFSELPYNIGKWLGDAAGNGLEALIDFGAWSADMAEKLGDWFGALPGKVHGWIKERASDAVDMWKWISANAEKLGKSLGEFFKKIPGKIWGWIKEAAKSIGNVWDWIKDQAVTIRDKGIKEWATGLLGQVADWIGSGVEKAKQTVAKAFEKVFKPFTEAWNGLADSKLGEMMGWTRVGESGSSLSRNPNNGFNGNGGGGGGGSRSPQVRKPGVQTAYHDGGEAQGNVFSTDSSTGKVDGPAGVDNVNSKLQQGEFVLRKPVAQFLGYGNLTRLNRSTGAKKGSSAYTRSLGNVLPRFQNGGTFGKVPGVFRSSNAPATSSNGGGFTIENVTINNPVGETTEESLANTSRKLAFVAGWGG